MASKPKMMAMVSIRMPAELREALERSAADGDRNLSQECVRRLRQSFEHTTAPTLPTKMRVIGSVK